MAVNLSPIGGVAAQFLDNSGNPLSGGKIYTYAAGTTTPQATYTSANGATAHSNPIILDAAGRVPSGEIWLTDGLQYKFLIKTSADVQIGSYDNIVGINSNFVNYTSSQEIQTATAGQTVFTLTTMQYQPGTNSLSVFVDGVNQYGPGALYAYVETSSTVVTFTSGLHVGADVKFTTTAINSSAATDAEQVGYIPPFTGSVPTNVEVKLAQTVSVKDFGAVGNGVADDTTKIQAALNSGAGTVYFPEGIYPVSSVLTLPSNITLTGDGVGNTKLTVVGTGVNNILYAVNRQNIKISDIWFYGNSQSYGSGNGLAIFFYQNSSATEIGGNFRIENCRFENFKGDYWVYVVNDNTTYNIANIYVNNNSFKSFPGNARDGTTPAVPSTCISVQGSTAGAEVTDVFVTNNSADCEHIKQFLLIWQGAHRVLAQGNSAFNVGLGAGISNDAGSYAFMAYDSTGTNVPYNIVIDGNLVDGVRSCGFYGAASKDIIISNNRFYNQTDTVGTTLPKGGVVLNSCYDVQIVGNEFASIATNGVYWQPGNALGVSANIIVSGNTFRDNAIGVKFLSYLFDSNGLNINGNTFIDCTFGVQVQTIGNTFQISGLSVVDNHIVSTVAASYGISIRSDDSFFKVSNAKISGNYVKTTGYGIYWRGAGPTTVSDNTFTGPFTTRALDVATATNLSITGNSFFGQTSGGECLYTTGSQGSMRENSFENCATANLIVVSGVTDMGRVVPTWTPTGRGPFVQNIVAVEAGTAGNKYVLSGWYYDGTAWFQMRNLTGN